jgi:chemotaxis protein MotB
MKYAFKTILVATSAVVLASCSILQQPDAPNDSVSRMLNEMKAKPRSVAPVVDPRDARIAALEKQVADLDAELARLRTTASNLTDANRRVSDLERQLADRDRELAALRSGAGDSSKLASQLSTTQGELDLAKGHISDLERSLAAAGAGAAAGQLASSERDKLAAELAAANNDKTRLAGELAALQGASGDKAKLAGELAAANRRIADLERQLADRDRELLGLRGELSTEMAKLKEAQRGLIRALRPQIEKGDIMVDLNNERLLINLASGYLFGTGEDQLKPAGANALKQVGAILKDFPEYKVAVDGHTDNRPIRSALKKKFPTNQALSEARAANAAKALTAGGLGAATTTGYADTKPVAPNTTDAGRAKNRRVEVRVTR